MRSRTDPGFGTEEVLAVLSRPEDPDVSELLELVADICESSVAGITIRRGTQFHVPALNDGAGPFACPAGDTFCSYTMDLHEVFTVEDAAVDERFAHIAWANGERYDARFYASAPIYAPDGAMLGRLCVLDSRTKRLTQLQVRALETMALSVTTLIELRLLRAGDGQPEPGAQTCDQAQQAVVSQLAAELSHDLRVPLTSVVAGVEMLQEELAGHPDRIVTALLAQTTRATDRMVRMLEQHMEFGAEPQAPEATADLGLVVEQLVLDSATLLETAGAVVQTDALPVVRADPDAMYSVFQNLLTNAVKFARPDTPARVRVGARPVDGGWRITVRDNGVGIPEERRNDVFALFSRVEHGVDGHGIGLATVARIVSAHGGRVGAGTAPGGGTEMWFELPA